LSSSDADSSSAACFPEFPNLLHLPVFYPQVKQLGTNRSVSDCWRLWGAVYCRAVNTGRHLQQLADDLDINLSSLNDIVLVCVNKHD
jgi:hypothetical protein